MKYFFMAIYVLVLSTTLEGQIYTDAELHNLRYMNKINTSLKELGSNKKFNTLHSEQIKDNMNSLSISINENIAITLIADSTSLKSFIFAARGDGSTASGVDLLLAADASIMALVNPYMLISERRDILYHLGLGGDIPVFKDKKTYNFDIKNYHITSNFIEGIGFMITADREIESKKKKTVSEYDKKSYSFVNPITYNESETSKKNVINYIKSNVKKQYSQINMSDPLTLRMMEDENLKAFKRLIHAGNKPLLQKVINQYCAINMCNYVTIKMMYEEQFKASKKTLKW